MAELSDFGREEPEDGDWPLGEASQAQTRGPRPQPPETARAGLRGPTRERLGAAQRQAKEEEKELPELPGLREERLP